MSKQFPSRKWVSASFSFSGDEGPKYIRIHEDNYATPSSGNDSNKKAEQLSNPPSYILKAEGEKVKLKFQNNIRYQTLFQISGDTVVDFEMQCGLAARNNFQVRLVLTDTSTGYTLEKQEEFVVVTNRSWSSPILFGRLNPYQGIGLITDAQGSYYSTQQGGSEDQVGALENSDPWEDSFPEIEFPSNILPADNFFEIKCNHHALFCKVSFHCDDDAFVITQPELNSSCDNARIFFKFTRCGIFNVKVTHVTGTQAVEEKTCPFIITRDQLVATVHHEFNLYQSWNYDMGVIYSNISQHLAIQELKNPEEIVLKIDNLVKQQKNLLHLFLTLDTGVYRGLFDVLSIVEIPQFDIIKLINEGWLFLLNKDEAQNITKNMPNGYVLIRLGISKKVLVVECNEGSFKIDLDFLLEKKKNFRELVGESEKVEKIAKNGSNGIEWREKGDFLHYRTPENFF